MNISRFPPRPIMVIAVLAVLAQFSLVPVVAQDENYANVFHNYLRGLAYASGGSILWHEGTIYTSTETYSIGSRCQFKSLLQCSVEFTEIVTELASYLAEIERYRPTEFAQAIIDGARS
ncbi:MAG: hypothetical protein OXH77_02765 [Anaerolineaceae bacterium]|nr:hypothetical protein [Anaerolineaceae bacterium]